MIAPTIPGVTPKLLLDEAPWNALVSTELPCSLSALEAVAWVATRDARLVTAVVGCAAYWSRGNDDWGAEIAAQYLREDVAAFFCQRGVAECRCCEDAAIAVGVAAAKGLIAFTDIRARHWAGAQFNWHRVNGSRVATQALIAVVPGPASPTRARPTSEKLVEVARELSADGIVKRDLRVADIKQRWRYAQHLMPTVDQVQPYMQDGKKGRPPLKTSD